MNSLKLAEKYNKNTPANQKKSKLDQHNEAIKYLIDNNHSLLSIKKFLENECSCKVAYSTLRDYCNRRFNSKGEIEDHAAKYKLIKEHCDKLKNTYLNNEEQKDKLTIISLIDYFVEKSLEKNILLKEVKSETDEGSTSESLFARIGKYKNK